VVHVPHMCYTYLLFVYSLVFRVVECIYEDTMPKGGIRESLVVVILPRPSQAQNDRILFIGIGQLPHVFVRVAVVVYLLQVDNGKL
jgi:hypothetical protein